MPTLERLPLRPETVLWLELILIVACGVAYTAIGYFACRRFPFARVPAIIIGGVAIGYRVLTSISPQSASVDMPYLLMSAAIAPAGFLLLGAGLERRRKNSFQRIIAAVFAVVLSYYVFCDAAFLAVRGPQIIALDGRWDGHVMRQTQTFTCGAAAGATLLEAWGIHVREGEMVYAARTSFRGTELSRLARAVRRFGRDKSLDVKIMQLDIDGLRQINRPAVLLVERSGYQHVITLLHLDGMKMTIADPAFGMLYVPVDGLKIFYTWTGKAIIADAPDGPRLFAGNH